MNPPTTCIENLPPEMICELFKHLPLKDLLVCPLVNRRWRSIYAGFRVSTLVVRDRHHANIINWSYPGRKFGDHQLCSPELFNRLADQPLLSNLKHLALLCDNDQFDYAKLRSFSQSLVHLEIIRFFGRIKKLKLKLSALQVLVCHYGNSRPLSIDCPKLKVLVYHESEEDSLLEVKRPETIRSLVTDMVSPKLAPFRSVERLITREVANICKDTLLSLPKLKELRYNRNMRSAFWEFKDDGSGRLNRMKRTLSEFMVEAKKLRGSDFRFRFAGFHLTPARLDQLDFGVQVEQDREPCNEYVYMKNYQLLDPDATLDFIDEICYTRLMESLPGELPADFVQKCTSVDTVKLYGRVQDEQHLLWFLQSLSSLRDLNLEDAKLSQEFYDQLPQSASSLVQLMIGTYDKTGRLLRLDFLRELPGLNQLSFRQPWFAEPIESYDSIRSLVSFLAQLNGVRVEFDFQFFKRSVRIELSLGRFRVSVWKYHDSGQVLHTPDELVEYLKDLLNESLDSDDQSY